MIAHGFSAMLWPAILVVAAVVGSLALTCVIPFAAFAVATVGTLKLRSALRTMAVHVDHQSSCWLRCLGLSLDAQHCAVGPGHRCRGIVGNVCCLGGPASFPVIASMGPPAHCLRNCLRAVRSRADRRCRAFWWCGSFCASDRRALCPDQRRLVGWISRGLVIMAQAALRNAFNPTRRSRPCSSATTA